MISSYFDILYVFHQVYDPGIHSNLIASSKHDSVFNRGDKQQPDKHSGEIKREITLD